MSSVKVVCMGDSLTYGSGSSGSFVYPVYLQNMLGMSAAGGGQGTEVLNKGIVGNHTSDMLARFSADVLANSPKVCVIEGGTNNVANGETMAGFIADMTSMISQCQAAGIIPIVVLIMPRCTAGSTNAIMQERDRWNVALVSLCATYSVAVVDLSSVLGQFRSGGDAGNLWDIQAAYDSGDSLHYNAAGQIRYATAISYAVRSALSSTVASSVVSSVNTPSSLPPADARSMVFNGTGFTVMH